MPLGAPVSEDLETIRREKTMNPLKERKAARWSGSLRKRNSSVKARNSARWAALRILLLIPFPLLAQQTPPTVTAGTRLRVQFNTEVGTGISRVNDGVEAHLLKPAEADAHEVLPVGTVLAGRVLAVRRGNKHTKTCPMIRLGFNRVTLPDGRSFPFEASLADLGVSEYVDSEGAASTKPPTKAGDIAVPVTTGAAGAGVGAIGGGAKGAEIGAGVGAAVGVLSDLAAHSLQWDDFKLKRGRKAWLRLDSDLETKSGDASKVATEPEAQKH